MSVRSLLILWFGIYSTNFILGVEAPPFLLAAWTCDIPCETNDEPPGPLRTLETAWCAIEVLGPKMIAQMTPLCQKFNGTSNARAMRISSSGIPAKCVCSGNVCPQEGPTKVGYSCTIMCPEETLPRRYSVCAHDWNEAWSVSSRICDHPGPPAAMRLSQVCDPTGQTTCGDGK